MTTYTVKVEEDGSTAWYLDGKIRRVEGPTFGYTHHTKFWYLDDKLHRTDGPAVESYDGTKYWYLDGKLHRTDGPAVEYVHGAKEWWQNGELHHTDGPAIEYADGTMAWYLHGKPLTDVEWLEAVTPKKPRCAGKLVEIDNGNFQISFHEKCEEKI